MIANDEYTGSLAQDCNLSQCRRTTIAIEKIKYIAFPKNGPHDFAQVNGYTV